MIRILFAILTAVIGKIILRMVQLCKKGTALELATTKRMILKTIGKRQDW